MSSLGRTFEGSLRPVLGVGSLRTLAGNRGPSRRRMGLLRGPDKYTVLDQRRRAAQIKARHAMDLIDVMERAGEGR
jgi:hypothetical protein